MKEHKKGDLNVPLIYFLVLTASFIGGFVIYKLGALPPLKCQFKEFTGYPCPTCGTTRLILSLYNLDIVSAFKFNPFMFLFGVILGLWTLTGFFPIFLKKKLVFEISVKEKKILVIVVTILFLLNWAYLVWAGI